MNSTDDFKDGETYACASQGEHFKKTEYGQVMRKPRHLSPHLHRVPEHSSPCSSDTGASGKISAAVLILKYFMFIFVSKSICLQEYWFMSYAN